MKLRTGLKMAAALVLVTVACGVGAQGLAQAIATQAQSADGYRNVHEKQLLTDFGWLARYKDANAQLPPSQPDDKRVVFMGDSITEGWHLDQSFSGKPYINRGISGQTTPQMLIRFRQDVLELKPKVVIILAGTNDVAGNTGPMTPEQTEGNIQSMAQLAAANGIRVVLCSVLPASHFNWAPAVQGSGDKILAINTWIKNYATGQGYQYVDYHSAMKDAQNGLPPELSKDGVHPLPAGYAIMAPLADAGIAKALAK
ncbi:SGNH/GDSL hydrolase family protein [Terracidiphilus gabretensis]|uniref:SGNH/GDSL hydrolase family protein n=1 Tax=Terracidiphilus gabretensis TaxID=1577687 RepID=UPI000A4B1750|nr:SGNH/GDSL hydrolase family protein [Terracidiphilus gabretensis]